MTVTAADLLATPTRPVTFVIGDLVPVGLTVLAGHRRTGTSSFALQAALAVGQGVPFLDRETDQGDVLYLSLDDGEQRLKRRLVKLAPETRDLDRIRFEFKAKHLPGGLVADLDAWLVTAGRPRLVVVDSFNRSDPGPRNGQSAHVHATAMLEPLQRWAIRHRIAVLLVDHLSDVGTTELQAIEVPEGLLDSKGMLATSDATLVLRRSGQHPFAQLHVTSRDFDDEVVALTIDMVTMHWSAKPWLVDPLAELSPHRRAIVEALRNGPTRLKVVANELGVTTSNASTHLVNAMRAGHVAKVDRGVYALDEGFAARLAPAPCFITTEDPALDNVDEFLTGPDAGSAVAATTSRVH